MTLENFLRAKDVVRLLRQQVAETGGQSAWAKKTGIHRTLVNKVLQGQKPLTKSILNALRLETVYRPAAGARRKKLAPHCQAGGFVDSQCCRRRELPRQLCNSI
jgi:hypothetical protein